MFEVWYIPFFEARSLNNFFLGEVIGYFENNKKSLLKLDSESENSTGGRDSEYTITKTRIVITESGKLKKFDRSDTKLIIVGHCVYGGTDLASDPISGVGTFRISANDLVNQLIDREQIKN